MPRKPTVPCYKTTDKIKRACKQLFEYEQYNFWYFEFGARAFIQNEGTKKQSNIRIALAIFLDTICGLIHLSNSPLIPLLPNTPLLHMSDILKEGRMPTIDEYKPYWPLLYTFFSKSHHTEFMIQRVFDDIDDEVMRNSLKKTI